MPVFSIQYNDKQVSDRLSQILAQTGNLKPALQEIGEYMLYATDQRFVTETDPQGIPWKPLTPFTLRQKRAKGRILKILQCTGLMRSRVNYQVIGNQCIVGVNDEKAKKHQLGIGVTKREFMGVSTDNTVEIIDILDEHVKQ
ncbi:phage virion morphogenesis protein [Nostoc sp. CHAB 5836]|uniref:phage virion morphogenesis protein n=1 Tax=Nostoc sp. CHAB 5836 TaxID=2780404 RepID=UPI001E596A18|nr:phage virion morphogenesis protein [Nostoc sp. CHAB 5836]MCC5618175.1 phage virion morphogenesis protein [Nostoc sp. CHAB 5836]